MGVFFSIIIPVYNGEQYIKNCLDSIYRQGLGDDDFEVICVNDCSTDNTAQVISEYGKFHQNIRLINHETNRRQGSARNTGVKVAKGDYILYIDADDTFESNALPLLRNVIEKNKDLDILKFDYALVERNGSTKNIIVNFFEQSDRIKEIAYKEQDKDVSNCIMRHHFFMYKMNILRYWWRLSYKDRKELLVTYQPMLPCKDKLVSFIGRYPQLFLMASTVMKPLLPGLRYVYLKIKDRKSSLL